jgi:hypothetical protein
MVQVSFELWPGVVGVDPVGLTARVGSSPSSGTSYFMALSWLFCVRDSADHQSPPKLFPSGKIEGFLEVPNCQVRE